MPPPDADRNLLLGIIALQMEFITRDSLVDAMHAWVLDKGKSLGEILLTRSAIDADDLAALETMLSRHLARHGEDPSSSLSALSSLSGLSEVLGSISDPDIRQTLMRLTTGPNDIADSTRPWPRAFPSIGSRYHKLRDHAKGGLGVVFVARDSELNREVALKEIQDRHADDPEARSRFVVEAEVTGGLEHPGIVPVYGLGHYPDGRPFYAMRFVKGDSLKDAIDRFHRDELVNRDPGKRAIELQQLLRRFQDVCNAVDYAHSRGVLHRDLKPANVMVGKYGETLVVDWGLAKVTGRSDGRGPRPEATLRTASGGSSETQAGTVLGTPAYMSPEQATGRLDLLGPASDVYSLGATLYALLTGKAPFARGNGGEILEKVRAGDFPRPHTQAPWLDRALESICLRAMSLRIEDRYGSPAELAEDIDRWIADEPVSCHRDGFVTRVARWGRRHKSLVVATTALTASTIIALAVGLVVVNAARKDTDRERFRAERAKEEAYRTALTGFHKSAEASLSLSRMTRYQPDSADPQRRALALIGDAARTRLQARDTLAKLGTAGSAIAGEERRTWDRRATDLRNEAVWWLTQMRLRREREMPLPRPFQFGQYGASPSVVAVRRDGQRVALALPRDEARQDRMVIYDLDGNVLSEVPLPYDGPADHYSPPSGIMAFEGVEVVRYSSVKADYRWDLASGGLDRRARPRSRSCPRSRFVTTPMPQSRTPRRSTSGPSALAGNHGSSGDRTHPQLATARRATPAGS